MMLQIKTFSVNMLEENTYVVFDETREAVIIDCGALFVEEQNEIVNFITLNQLKVVRLICTHGHFDHILGCQWAYDTYQLLPEIHNEDLLLYHSAEKDLQLFFRRNFSINLPPLGDFLTDGQCIRFGNQVFEVVFTPGHTPGGVCFYSAEAKIMFSGDTLFRGSIGRCDLPGGNYEQLINSIRTRLLNFPNDTIVYPGHGPSTTIAFERQHNPYF